MIWDGKMVSDNSYWSDSDEIDFDHKRDADYDEVIGHPPILSDCILWVRNNFDMKTDMIRGWNYSKPYLYQQSDELAEKLFELLS